MQYLSITRFSSKYLTLCNWETLKRVSLQAMKTQMKCSIMLHYIRFYTVYNGKKRSSDIRIIYLSDIHENNTTHKSLKGFDAAC